MKFIADFPEIEQYKAMAEAVDSIKELLTLSEIEEIRSKLPQGDFKTEEEKQEAFGNQGFKNLMEVVSTLMGTHAELLVRVNHAFWKPEIVKRPVKEEKWDDNGFLVEDYKRDEQGHIVYEEYQETENDYPMITKTIGKIISANESWLRDFFTLLKSAKNSL